MSEKPKCPYCGDKMILHILTHRCHATLTSAWYQCVTCDSESPHIEFPGDMANDKIIERLQAVSSRRAEPKNRVLTLAEVQNLAYVDYEQQRILTAGYKSIIKQAENVFCPCVVAHEDLNRVGVLEIYDGSSMKLREKSMYGKYWRCWLRKPSKEEMEGTPWES